MTDGWRCPGCGYCYAPTVSECPRCRPSIPTVVYVDGNAGCLHQPGPITTSGVYCVKCGMLLPPPAPPTITCGSPG